jgi:uncharacterized damage-inducible protein DinB
MIHSVEEFIQYFDGIRRRTLRFARAIPPDRIDWSPGGEAYTCGDLLRHLVAVEKITICEVADGRWAAYPGHDRDLAGDLEAVIGYLETTHAEAMSRLRALPDSELDQHRAALTGHPLKTWRLLMSMVEHEIHHRSQLASYLTMMGVEPPQIFGLGVEDVVVLSAARASESARDET